MSPLKSLIPIGVILLGAVPIYPAEEPTRQTETYRRIKKYLDSVPAQMSDFP